MREIRQSGSEGGESGLAALSYPYTNVRPPGERRASSLSLLWNCSHVLRGPIR